MYERCVRALTRARAHELAGRLKYDVITGGVNTLECSSMATGNNSSDTSSQTVGPTDKTQGQHEIHLVQKGGIENSIHFTVTKPFSSLVRVTKEELIQEQKVDPSIIKIHETV